MRRAVLVLGVLWLWGVAPGWAREEPRLEVDIAMGVSGSVSLKSVGLMSPLLRFSAPVTEESAFIAQWGVSIASGEAAQVDSRQTYVAPGNPLLGWSILLAEGLAVTPSLTIPVARWPDEEGRWESAAFAFRAGSALRGGGDPWLWRPDSFTAILPVLWAVYWEPVLVEVQLKIAYVIPTRTQFSSSDFIFQSGARLAWQAAQDLWLALAYVGVYTPTAEGEVFGASLNPEIRLVLGDTSHVALAFAMNFLSPDGPFYEPGRIWGVSLSGSASF